MFHSAAAEHEVRVFKKGALPELRAGVDVGCTAVWGLSRIYHSLAVRPVKTHSRACSHTHRPMSGHVD